MEVDRLEKRRIATASSAQDVGRESAVSGAGFDQIKDRRRRRGLRTPLGSLSVLSVLCGKNCRHLGDLNLEELAKEGADIDAGKKIARASRPPGRAGVVAELGIVKSRLHERGHRHRAALTDRI